jgi:hypothetical protein
LTTNLTQSQHDCLVLFPVHPLTVARYREAFTPSQAKDDPTDAGLQLERLLKHRDKLKPLQPQRATMRALEQLVASRRRLVGDTVRLTHRLTSTLKHYLPHVLQWFYDKDTTIFCDFLTPWPTLKAVQLARRASLERCFRDHHVRYTDVIHQRIHAMKSATPLTTDAGVITPNALVVQALVTQLPSGHVFGLRPPEFSPLMTAPRAGDGRRRTPAPPPRPGDAAPAAGALRREERRARRWAANRATDGVARPKSDRVPDSVCPQPPTPAG